jgi:hypothetical protein
VRHDFFNKRADGLANRRRLVGVGGLCGRKPNRETERIESAGKTPPR